VQILRHSLGLKAEAVAREIHALTVAMVARYDKLRPHFSKSILCIETLSFSFRHVIILEISSVW
jgi:hypothetical protein